MKIHIKKQMHTTKPKIETGRHTDLQTHLQTDRQVGSRQTSRQQVGRQA